MMRTPEQIEAWEIVAAVLAREIDDLDRETAVLMKAHASTKAAGPAHTSAHLERLARGILGPRWREAAARQNARLLERDAS